MGSALPLAKLQALYRSRHIELPKIRSSTATVSNTASDAQPATATVKVIPWAGTLTAAPVPTVGQTAGTLNAAFAGPSGVYPARFTGGLDVTITLTNGSAAFTMTAIGGSPADGAIRVNPNHLYNSPHVYAYNSAIAASSGLMSLVRNTNPAQEDFNFASLTLPTAQATGPTCVHFNFSGQLFELQLRFAAPNTAVLCLCDGEIATPLVSSTPLVGPTNNQSWMKFDFGASSAGVPKRISLYIQGELGSIAIGSIDDIEPWNRDDDVNMIYHGDSYATVLGLYAAYGGPFVHAALMSGFASWWGSGWGGTGYSVGNGATKASLEAIADLNACQNADLWLCGLGINETASVVGYDLYRRTVREYYQQVRRLRPDIVIAALGPFCPDERQAGTAQRTDVRDTILYALQEISGPWVMLDNLTGRWYARGAGVSGQITGRSKLASSYAVTTVNGGPSVNSYNQAPAQLGAWQTGFGRVGALQNAGNGDRYVSSDATHPTAAGVGYIGQRIAMGLRTAVLAL